MKPTYRRAAALTTILAMAGICAAPASAAVTMTETQLGYGQNFDSLPRVNGSDPLWQNNTTLAGWYLFAGPDLASEVEQLRVSTSSGSDRAHISYGTNNASDRALGFQSGSSHRYSPVTPDVGDPFGAIAVAFDNQTGSSLDSFSFSYTGEQWHVSSNANVAHSLTVQYAIGAAATPFTGLTWTAFTPAQQNAAGVDFVSPTKSGGTTGNGNLAANQVVGLGATVDMLDWQSGQRLWIRWVDINDPASDHGLAIDNFSFAATLAPVPEPESYAMLLAGLGLIGFAARRRKSA